MRVLHLASVDGAGGAGRAAYRLHESLVGSGLDSRMWVDVKTSGDWRVTSSDSFLAGLSLKARIATEQIPTVAAGIRGGEVRTSARFGGLRARQVDASSADVVDLHWTGFGFLTIEQIGRIGKPMVWTMHDMWAFLGTEHYADDGPDAPWRGGYVAPRADGTRFDIERWAWRRKYRSWTTPHQLVAPSRWLARCVAESALLGAWPVTVIPNPLDLGAFTPHDKGMARRLLGLPAEVPLVLFGVISGLAQDRKGWDLLQEALGRVAAANPAAEIVVLGHTEPREPLPTGLPRAHWLGQVNDDLTLALVYSAADVAVVPSRMDNLPQSATEPQACGCPVVAFDVGGLPDIVVHDETGYLAAPFDTSDLANGIISVLDDADRRRRMGVAARERAERLWAPSVVVPQYLDAYRQALEGRQAPSNGRR